MLLASPAASDLGLGGLKLETKAGELQAGVCAASGTVALYFDRHFRVDPIQISMRLRSARAQQARRGPSPLVQGAVHPTDLLARADTRDARADRKAPESSPRMRSRSPLASARSGGSIGSGMGGYSGNGSRSNLEVVALRGVASHAWHDVPYGEIAPEVVNVVVEIPADSKVKYCFDKESGMLGVDKILASSMVYPHNYGFIPQTLIGDQGEPLGVIVMMQKPVQPMTFLQVRLQQWQRQQRPCSSGSSCHQQPPGHRRSAAASPVQPAMHRQPTPLTQRSTAPPAVPSTPLNPPHPHPHPTPRCAPSACSAWTTTACARTRSSPCTWTTRCTASTPTSTSCPATAWPRSAPSSRTSS
jgi:hypothetical protein